MSLEPIEYRAEYELVLDKVLTRELLRGPNGRDLRVQALTRVLRCIPPREYSLLKRMFESGEIMIEVPDKNLLGHLKRVLSDTKAVLYLFPKLEKYAYREVLSATAHEISHAYLHLYSYAGKETKEREADNQARIWGF